jgi:putative hydrolase of the HAD superfamily
MYTLNRLGLTHDDLQFQVYSKDVKIEKPDARVFMATIDCGSPFLPSNDPIEPSEVLHIGNDFQKDFEGARGVGMHSVLLDRYNEEELAGEWRRRGVRICIPLIYVGFRGMFFRSLTIASFLLS